MIYAEILAGGIGTRMDKDIPKQYIEINDKPIICYTLEKFLRNEKIDKIIICCQSIWKQYLLDCFKKFQYNLSKIDITESGINRNDTMYLGCKYIEKKYGICESDRIITVDAVRMFVSERIINDNIKQVKVHDAVGTFFPVIDTIMESNDSKEILNIPLRKNMYQVQAPQSFHILKLMKYYEGLSEDIKQDLTDVCKIFFINNESIKMVDGEYTNFKITYPNDIEIAKNILKNNNE